MASDVRRLDTRGRPAVVWGAGSKGVAFLNTIDTADASDNVVDINPRKHGMHVAGTGQEIIGPAALKTADPSLIIVMNPNYAMNSRPWRPISGFERRSSPSESRIIR